MDLKIVDNWLRDYLVTKTTPNKIAEYLSLCGPSVERIEKIGGEDIYDIEVTTNRVDSASVYGIAREAAAILPRFKVKANLKKIKSDSNEFTFTKNVSYLKPEVDGKLCPRFTAVLIKNVKINHSPDWMIKRLEASGVRAINNIVDISNYIMLALGQPVHTFDYDKIKGAKMILRESKKSEKITTLDGKKFNLPGEDIVIEDGERRLIDLAGIMGGALSMVDDNTKNVLLFVQTYNPVRIRKTSMALAQRTGAATLFEKGIDPELVSSAILMGIEMFTDLCKGKAEKEILDIYPKPYKAKKITTDYNFISNRLGITISKKEIVEILNSLEFEALWKGNKLEVFAPSFRARDFEVEEDVLEEIARIYGYNNLPSQLMVGKLPAEPPVKMFSFEDRIKDILAGWGGIEVYTLSLVPKEFVSERSLKLKNPLGPESEYLRTSLMPSLISAEVENQGKSDKFHLFEMANIYSPKADNLPNEVMALAGIFEGYKYREAKGIIEALLAKLNIGAKFEQKEEKNFRAGSCAIIWTKDSEIGKIGIAENTNLIYYEFEVEKLSKNAKGYNKYKDILKFPPQVEDITLVFPPKTRMGDVLEEIMCSSSLITAELTSIYKDSYTFRIWYQDPKKTLTDKEVEEVRNKILQMVKSKFGGGFKN